MFENIYKNKNIIITGHTGFKGSWLSLWLKLLGANVIGVSLGEVSFPSHFKVTNSELISTNYFLDISDLSSLKKIIKDHSPDFLFHLAAQSLVSVSYNNPIETWQTNVIGTLNFLESLRGYDKKCSAVIITSDKCYKNVEWVWGYREIDTLGGNDPYSASKASAEILINSYVKTYFPADGNVRLASARAGNVIGGGDWAIDRIIPDAVRAWSNNKVLELRNPNATRPWQHVLEPLSGYLLLASHLNKDNKFHGEAFNFGPQHSHHYSVLDLMNKAKSYWEKASWEKTKNKLNISESNLLMLNCDKASNELKWRPVLDFNETLEFTIKWYKSFYQEDINPYDLTISQINQFCANASKSGLLWAQEF